MLLNKISELKKVSTMMEENVDNISLIKFFAGQLSLLSREISSMLVEIKN